MSRGLSAEAISKAESGQSDQLCHGLKREPALTSPFQPAASEQGFPSHHCTLLTLGTLGPQGEQELPGTLLRDT